MVKESGGTTIPVDLIQSKIYLIRGYKVMIDRDLANLYGVDTRVLNQAVKRHELRFLADFMFQMTKNEMENWKSTASGASPDEEVVTFPSKLQEGHR